ncbi:fibronectin type III domain-containing protein [bacterium]|nr:fibronectin type III domain-containing protein [bacterium]
MINNKRLILWVILLMFLTGNVLFGYAVTNEWLDERLVEWKPLSYKRMNFAAYHVFASDDMFEKSNAEIDIKMLDVLVETESDIIVMYIRPQVYSSQKVRYDDLINKIRSEGKKLFIGARFNDVPMTFEEYSIQLSSYTQNIIASIKPDYYGIVIEPQTMQAKHSFNVSVSSWVALVGQISDLSKQMNPDTKTSVGGHKEELEFLQLASNISSMDIIGFNLYDNQGIYPEYSGYLGLGDVVGETIDFANSKGKETWLMETWTTWIGSDAMDQQIDGKWIKVMAYYAVKHNMKAITPFFTGKFVYYGSNPVEFKSALDSGQRTTVFYAYKELINEFSLMNTILCSNVLARNITGSGATITWTTNKPSTSTVKYGIVSGNYGYEISKTELTTQHSLTLDGLTPGKKYYYIVISTDSGGNTGQSNKYNFSTASPDSMQDILEQKINVYPNPYVKGKSRGKKISFTNLGQGAIIKLYNTNGELVKELPGGLDGKREWDISEINAGIYFYVIKANTPKRAKRGKVCIIK